MDDVLTGFSEATLVNAIKTNYFELLRHVGRSPNVEFFEGPPVTWCITGVPDAFADAVFQTRLGGAMQMRSSRRR